MVGGLLPVKEQAYDATLERPTTCSKAQAKDKLLRFGLEKERWKVLAGEEAVFLARLESALLKGARKYLDSKGFVEVIVPHLTKATGACENIDTMFEVDYFGRRAYLSQTGQLYLEALAPALKKVWTIIQSFRAEPEVDGRHLTQFTLVEFEFLGTLDELMFHVENAISSMVSEVLRSLEEDLSRMGIDLERLYHVKPPFKRISYKEAVSILSDQGVMWGDDLKSYHEKALVERLGNVPVFVTHYPKEIKFFNMRENDRDSSVVNSVDLLLPFSGEAVGGAEREYTYEALLARLRQSSMLRMLRERGGSEEDFDWYLSYFRANGGNLHSGCGIGLNRVAQFVLGIEDIRATTVYPLNREMLY